MAQNAHIGLYDTHYRSRFDQANELTNHTVQNTSKCGKTACCVGRGGGWWGRAYG